MEKTCSFDGCNNKHHAYGYCVQHRRQVLAGQDLHPLPGRAWVVNKGAACPVLDCGRPARQKGMCLGHYHQQRRGVPFRPISTGRTNAERWASLTPEEREARLAPMREGQRKPRTEQHARRISESLRARYRTTPLTLPKVRTCRGCEVEFTPNSGSHFFCTVPCRQLTGRLKRRGMDRSEWNRLLQEQQDGCALCGLKEAGWNFGVGLVIDHCHKTGAVRGLLCGDCNTALGRFGDDPERLRAAAAYLERYQA